MNAIITVRARHTVLLCLVVIVLCFFVIAIFDRLYGYFYGMLPYSSQYYSDDIHILGFAPLPGGKERATFRFKDRIIFDVTYNIDQYGRRVVPQRQSSRKPKRYAVFFGDSFPFGVGVENHEALPAIFEDLMPEYSAYNYAYQGYGSQQMLGKLEIGFLPGELEQDHGIGIYIYNDGHIDRVNGNFPVHAWSGGRQPRYGIESNGKLARIGTFATTQPLRTRLHWLLGKSYFLRTRQHYFFGRSPGDYELTCAIIREARARFERLHVKNKFYVFVAPWNGASDIDFMKRECFAKYKINSFDLSAPLAPPQEGYLIEYDNHWNAKGHRWVAENIANILKTLGKN